MHQLNRNGSQKRRGVEAWMPEYAGHGYSREEAEEIVRTAERLWRRCTASGITIDSPDARPSALVPFEVLLRAILWFEFRRLLTDVSSPHRQSAGAARGRTGGSPSARPSHPH